MRLSRLSTKHAEEVAFLESLKSDLAQSSGTDSTIIRKLETRISTLQFGTDAMVVSPQPSEVSHPASHVASGSHEKPTDATALTAPDTKDTNISIHSSSTPPESKETDASILTALEYMAWGRSFGNCYPHISCTCHHHRRGFNVRVGNDATTTGSSSRSLHVVSSSLPSVEDARRLVGFHLRYLAWHHNCLHGPTFLEECEGFWGTGACGHPLWLASYLAVLSVSLDVFGFRLFGLWIH